VGKPFEFARRSCERYHPFYCEENIWHLARGRGCGDVVFITNRMRRVLFRSQVRIPQGATEMLWDYHVVWLAPAATDAAPDAVPQTRSVWDFDTVLPWPVSAARYVAESFPHQEGPLAPLFRVVPVDAFVAQFASDRRHMRDVDGAFLEPQPPWPCIGDGSNLEDYLGMQQGGPGTLMTLAAFAAYASGA
jgi:protein N-terminal glutamine amidohydrolase